MTSQSDPIPGQMDVWDCIAEVQKDQAAQPQAPTAPEGADDRPLSAREVVNRLINRRDQP